MAGAVLPEIIANVIRKIVLGDTAIRARLDDVDDVVLLPLLEIILAVLIEFFALDVGGFQRARPERLLSISIDAAYACFVLIIKRKLEPAYLLVHLVQDADALVGQELLHEGLVVKRS